MNNIDTLIFDFGGVIINLDYSKPVSEFKKLGILDSKKLYSKKDYRYKLSYIRIIKILRGAWTTKNIT